MEARVAIIVRYTEAVSPDGRKYSACIELGEWP
jgi:hypothetical protein